MAQETIPTELPEDRFDEIEKAMNTVEPIEVKAKNKRSLGFLKKEMPTPTDKEGDDEEDPEEKKLKYLDAEGVVVNGHEKIHGKATVESDNDPDLVSGKTV